MDRAGNMHARSEHNFDLRRCVPMSREEEHHCAPEETGYPRWVPEIVPSLESP